MNKTTPSQSDDCRLKIAHHLRENFFLSLVAVSVVLVFRYLTSGEAERVDRRQPAVTESGWGSFSFWLGPVSYHQCSACTP
jgi:hypothetical protein